jgi:methylenetetrahydrofolate reductase (NADPH)
MLEHRLSRGDPSGRSGPALGAGRGRPAPAPLAASIEATAKQLLAMPEPDLADLFPAGTRVYLADVGGTPVAATVEASRRLAHAGYRPVPHLAARRIEDRGELAHRLERLVEDGFVEDVLVIAGGVARPAGPFASSMDLLAAGLLEAHGIREIGVAGHPEGSPDIAAAEVERALAWKNDYAARTGSSLRIVTQFSFDARAIAGWCDALDAAGNRLPVHLGIAGPAKVTTLVKYAAICGVGASLSFLKKQASKLSVLATSYSPEAFVAELERGPAVAGGTVAQLHVFPFGGLEKSGDWLRARGSWPQPAAADAADAETETTVLRTAEAWS